MSSDIFDAYAKLALEKGIIKIAQEKESKELKKYKSDSYPRAGSDTIEVIESKYNTRPDKPESQKYKHNIMEVAHPEKVILNPAYDKINALIENHMERQRVIINITQKPVNGHLTQHKYAQEALAKSLVSIANDLDNRNIEPLRKLADECIEDLYKKAFDWKDWFKEKTEDAKDIGGGAAAGAELGAIAGGLLGAFGLGPAGMMAGAWGGAQAGTLIGGALSAIFATAPQAKNVAVNAQEAKTQLDDLIKDHKNDIFLTTMDTALSKIIEAAGTYASAVDQAHVKTDDPQAKQNAFMIGKNYQQQIENLDKMIDIFLVNAERGDYEAQENDTWSKIKKPFAEIFGDEVQEVVQAFRVLERVNKIAIKGIEDTQKVTSVANSAASSGPSTLPAQPVAETPSDAQQKLKQELDNWRKEFSPQ